MTPEALRAWRQARNLTQGELGAILGVTWVTVSRWENGHRAVPSFLELALRAIDADRAEWLDGRLPS
jgi:transcriptional regulator with XRE-family HTH domain